MLKIEKILINIWAPPTIHIKKYLYDIHIWHFEGEHAKSLEVCAVANNPAVGAPDVSMDGCLQSGMGTTDTQKQVKMFGCMKYKLHRRNITHTFDQ